MTETGFYSRNADIVAFFVKQARTHDHIYMHPPACALSLSLGLSGVLFVSFSLSSASQRKKKADLAKQDNEKPA
jgi:hypothetical protein